MSCLSPDYLRVESGNLSLRVAVQKWSMGHHNQVKQMHRHECVPRLSLTVMDSDSEVNAATFPIIRFMLH